LQGEQHQLPTLPQGVPIFYGDRIMDPKKNLDHFLTIFDIHLIKHDDVMVRLFLQTLIVPTYGWYLSLPEKTISYFDNVGHVFMYKLMPPISYHTLLTQCNQIHLQKD
jgi:hypothetical protein